MLVAQTKAFMMTILITQECLDMTQVFAEYFLQPKL